MIESLVINVTWIGKMINNNVTWIGKVINNNVTWIGKMIEHELHELDVCSIICPIEVTWMCSHMAV